MDLIGENPILNIQDNNFRISSRNLARPPQFHGKNSVAVNSLISEGCKIYGTVENSILSGGVIVEEGAVVRDCVIMEDVIIKAGAKVFTSIIDSDAVIGAEAVVGTEGAGKDNITVIAKGRQIAPKATVKD